jgi:hypothetical protein
MSNPAAHHRLSWDDLPLAVRDRITAQYGPVEKVETVPGLRPGFAGRVYAKGDNAFIKAVPSTVPPADLDLFRREREAARVLLFPGPAPLLLWMTAEVPGWLLFGWELINDNTRHANLGPGSEDLPFVVDAVAWIATQPVDLVGGFSRSVVAHYTRRWSETGILLDQPGTLAGPDLYRAALKGFDVCRLAGDSLVHTGLGRRTILVKGPEVYLVDWSQACLGAWWVDLVSLAPHVIAAGHTPGQADDLLGVVAPHWPQAPSADVAGLAALVALHHRYQAEYGPKKRSAEELRLADAGHEWLAYWLARRVSVEVADARP